jgi:hypothetical protein
MKKAIQEMFVQELVDLIALPINWTEHPVTQPTISDT